MPVTAKEGARGATEWRRAKLCSLLVQRQPGGLIRAAKQAIGPIKTTEPSGGSNYNNGEPGNVCRCNFRIGSWPWVAKVSKRLTRSRLWGLYGSARGDGPAVFQGQVGSGGFGKFSKRLRTTEIYGWPRTQ